MVCIGNSIEKGANAAGVVWLLALALMAIVFQRQWVALLRLEPENNPVFKRKHRRFQVIAGALVLVVLACAVGFDVLAGEQ